MKVLIIGAGAVGSVLARKLASDRRISEITTASRERVFHENHINRIKLDAKDSTKLLKAAKGKDIIINASVPDLNEKIMKAALKAGANYQDTCSHLKDLKNPEQLKYDTKFRKEGLTGLINTGLAPGVTNLLAREIADRLDSIENMKIRLLEDLHAEKFIFTWSKKVTLDLLNLPGIEYHDGKLMTVPPFEDPETYNFPRPHGRKRTYTIYGDEVTTIPQYIRLANLDYKSGGKDIELAKKIVNSRKKVNLRQDIPPPHKIRAMMDAGVIRKGSFVSCVEANGMQKGKKMKIKMSAVYPTMRQIPKGYLGSTYISYPTGIACAAFTIALPKCGAGVYPPEAMPKRARALVLDELKKSKVQIQSSAKLTT